MVEKLLDQLDTLPDGDEIALDAFKREGTLILSRIFGESHKYTIEFGTIPFHHNTLVTKEGAAARKWHEAIEITRNLFNAIVLEFDTFPSEAKLPIETDTVKDKTEGSVFLAHGHDKEVLEEVEKLLLRLGLTPIILQDRPSLGQTVIEKFEQNSDVQAAIVIFTPDDLAYRRKENPNTARLRARQNVVFELGFFVGGLQRNRTVLVYRSEENFEIPSDLAGVVQVRYSSGRNEWKSQIATELIEMGYKISPETVARALGR